jgi:CTP-dependent riboflavin kinase
VRKSNYAFDTGGRNKHMCGYLNAIIISGPNKGRTVGECILFGCNIAKESINGAAVKPKK